MNSENSERPLNPVFNAIRKALPLQILAAPILAATAFPINPSRIHFLEGTPMGLELLYTADSIPEADMLRQVLIEAGFHVEYVPASAMGVFGVSGSPTLYVPDSELAAAAEFLRDYLNPPASSAS